LEERLNASVETVSWKLKKDHRHGEENKDGGKALVIASQDFAGTFDAF
jgi:hypothetical protein